MRNTVPSIEAAVPGAHTDLIGRLHREDIARAYAADDGQGVAPAVTVSQMTDERHLTLDRVGAEARAADRGTDPAAEYADAALSTAIFYLDEALRLAPDKGQALRALRSAFSLVTPTVPRQRGDRA